MTASTADSPSLSESAYEVLRAAVNLARNEQLRSVAALRRGLLSCFPGRGDDIEQALAYWAHNAATRRSH